MTRADFNKTASAEFGRIAGIPVECVAIAAGIDRIVDMGRTVMSITGDASCAIVMQKISA